MRVVLVSLNARAGDAVGRQLVDKVATLVDRGLTVDVVLADDYQVHPALRPYAICWRSGRSKAWKTLEQADLVFIEFTQFHPLLEWLPLLADGQRRFVFDYHGLTPPALGLPHQRGELLRGQDWLGLAQLADVVVTHSQFATDELLEWVDVPPARMCRLGYPVVAVRDNNSPNPIRQQLGLNNARLLLFVGRAAPNKRIPTLIEAIVELRDCDPQFHAVLVGPSGGAYEIERLKCRELAADLGVADRVHWLGEVDESTLLDCYRSADALVMPSRHEGFCWPVIEAMTQGLPVLAARAGALPETVGGAGLLFEPDDARDLARQVRRLFMENKAPKSPERIAVVTPRFGNATGGAERSLTLLARQLHETGRDVTVFTTKRDDDETLPFSIRVFASSAVESRSWYHTDDEQVSLETEAHYWQNTLRSDELIAALTGEDYDAVIVGPYLFGLTRDVVRACDTKTILVPCLHDETAASRPGVSLMFQQAGGVLFHSPSERQLAEKQLGLGHPNNAIAGTWIDTNQSGDANRGRRLVGAREYFVYCGRLIREKGVPELIDQARRFAQSRPGAKFVFIGTGAVQIPKEPWAVQLGAVSDAVKHDVLAGASALITLSVNESLSLVVLEANALGVPVVVNAQSASLAEHVVQGGGGLLLQREGDFTRCLDRLLDHPNLVHELGQRGRRYVQNRFGSVQAFRQRITSVLDGLTNSRRQQLIVQGRRRAAEFNRTDWRRSLEQMIDAAVESKHDLRSPVVEISIRERVVPANEGVVVAIAHVGGRPLIPTGPARSELLVRFRTTDNDSVSTEKIVPLRRWLSAGQTQKVSLPLPNDVPLGPLVIEAGLRTYGRSQIPIDDWHGPIAQVDVVNGINSPRDVVQSAPTFARSLSRIRQAGELPTGFVDVSTGRMARLKKWVKAKLLHNFRTAYVDVLAQQQTIFNRRIVESLEQIADTPDCERAKLHAELAQTRQQCDDLAVRVAQLESTAERRPSKVSR